MNVYICDNLKSEAESVIRQLGKSDVTIYPFPARCGHPPLEIAELKNLDHNHQPSLILGGICLQKIRTELAERKNTHVRVFDNCFELLLEKGVVEYFIRKGVYLVTPGWLANWQAHVQEWKFSRETARDFFRESCQSILLLDTGVDAASSQNLRDFAKFVDRKADKIQVGTTALKRLIQSVLQNRADQTYSSESADKRHLSDYAMAMDLLVRMFAGNLNEKAIIETILNTFSMLFAPSEMIYLKIEDSISSQLYSKSGLKFDDPATVKKLASLKQQYIWQPSGKGFMLQLHFNKELFGVISIDAIAFPEYKQHYLDLAVFLAEVYSLAIANARRYDIIHDQKEKLDFINKELNKREEYFRSLYERAPLGYQSLDANGNLLNVNQAWRDTLGYSESEVIGKWFGDLLIEESTAKFRLNFPKFLESGQIDEIEFKMIKNNGDIVDISFSGKVLKDTKGKIIRIHCILKDITRQKEILRTLEEAAKQSKNLEGFIPICANCNKIRDDDLDEKPWLKPADYFSNRYPDLKFSHGICPECMHKLYPEYSDKKS